MLTVAQMVKDNKRVDFIFYKDQSLWYKTECNFVFPVPLSEIGNTMFPANEKAIVFMRYIRKHHESVSGAKTEFEEELQRTNEKPTDSRFPFAPKGVKFC